MNPEFNIKIFGLATEGRIDAIRYGRPGPVPSTVPVITVDVKLSLLQKRREVVQQCLVEAQERRRAALLRYVEYGHEWDQVEATTANHTVYELMEELSR